MLAIPRRWTIMAALAGLVAAAGGTAAFGQGEPARPAGEAEKPVALKKYILGATYCNQCHTHPENYQGIKSPLLCRMLEGSIWTQNDKHKLASKALTGDRGRAMGDRLGIDVSESRACISCHGIIKDEGVDSSFFDDPVADGVTCVACHGAFDEWAKQHTTPNKPDWRKLTRQQKQDRFGMTDLWDPVTRGQKCVSCHIGSPEEEKVVTHAMYAAGHPPLPGIEVATFSDAQPRHWQYLREKKDEIQKNLGVNITKPKREQTELVAVSGIVALGEVMRLFSAQAAGDGLVKAPETHWPDFARFDCSGCHHDLQVPPNWRQQTRGFSGGYGRPMIPTWPAVLVQLGITVAYPDVQKDAGKREESNRLLDQKVEAFLKAIKERPYGDPKQAARAAAELTDWAESVAKALRDVVKDPTKAVVDGPMAIRLLHQLCDMAQSNTLDYDASRQIAWAFRAIYNESHQINPREIPDPAIPQILDAIDKQFTISLPSAGKQEEILKTLMLRLKSLAEFDPVTFQSQFAALRSRLPSIQFATR